MATWVIDPDHSAACFAVRYMTITNVRGMFSRVTGTIHFDPPHVSKAAVSAEIDVASVDTGVKKRDHHLRSGEILDAEGYPKITFTSTAIEPLGANRARVTGSLTLHGITRQIAFEGDFHGPVKSPFGGETMIGFSASAKLNRDAFGILWGSDPVEGGGLMTALEIDITLDIEADLAGA